MTCLNRLNVCELLYGTGNAVTKVLGICHGKYLSNHVI